MSEDRRSLQFSLLKLLLWTAAVAQLLGILAIVGTGLTVTLYIVSWSVAVGTLHVVVARKAAIYVSVAFGMIAATAWYFYIIDEYALRGIAFIAGALFGPVLGLVVSALVQITLDMVDAVEKLLRRVGNGGRKTRRH